MSKCLYCEEEITPDQESFSKNGIPHIHRECFKVNEGPQVAKGSWYVNRMPIGTFKGHSGGIKHTVSNVFNRSRL